MELGDGNSDTVLVTQVVTDTSMGAYGKMSYSSNFESWTAITLSPMTDSNVNGIAYGGSKFVAVGNRGIAYSSDGASWTMVADLNNNAFNGIAYGNNRFVAVGTGGRIAYCDW